MKRYALMGAILLALVAWAAWRMAAQSDERIIRRTLRDAVQALEKNGPENPITAARRADRAAQIFVENPVFSGRGLNARWRSRTELRSGIFHARASVEQLSINLHDISISMEPSGDRAELNGTARIRGAGIDGSGRGQEFVEFATEWIKTPDGWRLAVLRRVEAIRHPQSGRDGNQPIIDIRQKTSRECPFKVGYLSNYSPGT